jgi:hypothetical protein
MSEWASPVKTNERSVRNNIDLALGSELAVCKAGGKEFQLSMDLLKREEQNLVEPTLFGEF